jgi:transcription-repair coupling factor (superfamily II helicase)
MLINKAQNFGLAELYQLRGRVGRANKQAYCYLIIPEMKKLPQKALQRLQAIEEFTDLGSGFKLAMKDMEIRGAGNLLGAEQSGFIIDMGFELFHKILDEAVTELKEQEFKDFFSNGLDTSQADFLNNDIAIELNTDALLPETYVKRDTDRFELYKKMYSLKSYSDLELLAQELEDKYGKLPVEAKELLFAVKVRIVAQFTGFSRIIFKPTRIICEFPPQSDENFYNFAFPLIMDFVQDHSGANLRQTPNKLFLEFDIKNREQAIEILWKIKRILEFAETE